MVIVTDRNGQLCNRIFHFSYFIANAIEYQYSVIYPCFDQYVEFFESTSKNNFFQLPISIKITPFRLLDRAILYFIKKKWLFFMKDHYLNISTNSQTDIYDLNKNDYQRLAHTKIVFTKGWMFRDHENLKKHKGNLKQIFTPVKSYIDDVNALINPIREKFDIVVGVHIRRGDYDTWQSGRYFYSDNIYLKKMEEIHENITAARKSCCFFITSNEIIDKVSFSTLNVNIGQRHYITDLYSLAKCDYIIGPPSTFSQWASFYGDVPLLILENSNTNTDLNNFAIF